MLKTSKVVLKSKAYSLFSCVHDPVRRFIVKKEFSKEDTQHMLAVVDFGFVYGVPIAVKGAVAKLATLAKRSNGDLIDIFEGFLALPKQLRWKTWLSDIIEGLAGVRIN